MKRYPPYDPIEYLEWVAVPEVQAEYRRRIDETPGLRRAVEALGRAGFERLYKGLVRTRLYDITLKRWVRTGVLTKAWLGQGEEAVTVGAAHALGPDDVVGPMIRNAAACFERGISLEDCLKVYLATGDTITQGRDLHIGDLERGVISPVSLVGDLVPVLAGFAMAFRMRHERRVALTWVGDGATRTGAFHEGMAMATARGAPLIAVIQDNCVALGTECDERLRRALRGMPAGYACEGLECDGNNIFDVHFAVSRARELCLAGKGPVLVYAATFRMGGHATHDEREARSLFGDETFRRWGARDPVGCMEEFLAGEKRAIAKAMGKEPRKLLAAWEEEVGDEVAHAEERALAARGNSPPVPALMLGEVYGTGAG